MAADRALIAGAAKVAGAKAKLDNATLNAFTDLGKIVGENAQSILKDMQEKENARNEAIAEGLSTINSQSIKPPNEHVGTIYDTSSTQEIYNKPVGTLTGVLNIQGTNFNYDAQTTQNKDVMDQQNAAQTMSNVVTSEMEKRNGYLAQVQTAGFNYSPFHDIKSDEGIATQAYLDGTAKWEPKEPGGDPNSYGYRVGDKFYTTAQMQKIVGNATAPDNSKEVFDFLDNSSKRSFSTATNNQEADVIGARIKSEILADENTLNNFLVHRGGGTSLQTLKSQKGFDAGNEIDRFINEQRAMHYDAPSTEPTITPNKAFDIAQDKKEEDEFNTFVDGLSMPSYNIFSLTNGVPRLQRALDSNTFQKDLAAGGVQVSKKVSQYVGVPDEYTVTYKNKTSKPLNLTQDIDYLQDIIKSLY
tara:strand:- start:15501 stop:16745 length:1245 start_codon:yes stop_codon:yes gene_type:complete